MAEPTEKKETERTKEPLPQVTSPLACPAITKKGKVCGKVPYKRGGDANPNGHCYRHWELVEVARLGKDVFGYALCQNCDVQDLCPKAFSDPVGRCQYQIEGDAEIPHEPMLLIRVLGRRVQIAERFYNGLLTVLMQKDGQTKEDQESLYRASLMADSKMDAYLAFLRSLKPEVMRVILQGRVEHHDRAAVIDLDRWALPDLMKMALKKPDGSPNFDVLDYLTGVKKMPEDGSIPAAFKEVLNGDQTTEVPGIPVTQKPDASSDAAPMEKDHDHEPST